MSERHPHLRAVPGSSLSASETLLFDLHAEAAILANVLWGGAGELPHALLPEHFYSEAHRRTLEACIALRDAERPVSLETVEGELRNGGRLAQVDGRAGLLTIQASAGVLSPRVLRELTEKVIERAGRRRTKEIAARLVALCDHDGQPLAALLESMRAELERVDGMLAASSEIPSAMATVTEAIAAVRGASEGRAPSVPTGFAALDALLSGGMRQELVVLAGRIGQGKTAMATQIALLAASSGVGVFVKPLEARADFTQRMLAARAGVPVSRVLSGRLKPEDWSALTAASDEVARLPLLVDDAAAVTGGQLCDRARVAQVQLRRQGVRLGLVVVDYLQELRPSRVTGSREQDVAENTRRLRDLAAQLGVTVLGLAQLNRDVERGPARKPRLSDLRESGQIEQDARVVMLLSREGDDVEVHVAKANNGPTGRIRLRFDAPHLRFEDAGDEPSAVRGRGERRAPHVAPSPAAATAPTDDEDEDEPHAFADMLEGGPR